MKPVLITGGAKGLGAAIALTLAKKGFDIVIHYNTSETEAKKIATACTKEGVHAEIIQGDLSDPETFSRTYPFTNTIGLVNNVGTYLTKPLTQTTPAEWHTLLHTNLLTPLTLTHTLLPTLQTIVNIGTSGAHTNAPAYALTKSALLTYTQSLARELAPQNITVNMVSPGYLENSIDTGELPMGRPATLQETAHIVSLFFDESHRYITGQNLEVAGGVGL